MSCDCNAVRGRHLEALAGVFAGKVSSVSAVVADLLAAYGDFTGATSVVGGKNGLVPAPKAGDNVKFLCGDGTWSTVPSGDVILDTVPATVNGGMWYEVENGTPIPKIYYNGQAYPLGGAVDPELTVKLTSSSVATIVSPVTATVDYNGDGNISVTASNKNVKPTYNSSTRTITVPYADVEGTITITVELSASTGFASARKTFTLTMEEIDPNLQVTPSANTVPVDGSITAEISFKGSGTPTAKIGDTNLTVTNKKITIPYVSGVNSATVTVNLTASNGYTAATKNVTLSMATADPDLQVTPSANTVPVDGSITATVSYNGSGTISAKMGDTNLTYNKSTRKITIPYVSDVDSVTITVNLTAAPGYKTATKSVTVSMAAADPNLQVKLSANTIPVDGSVTATVTYNGGGTLTAKKDNTTLTVTDKKFTVSYVPNTDSVTITVNLTATPGYTAATKTITIPMELADPGLSLSLDKTSSTFNAPATLSISFNGGGTPTAKMDDTNLTVTNNTATIPYVSDVNYVTITVSLSASPGYRTATSTIRVLMTKADPKLRITAPTGRYMVSYNETAVLDVSYLSTGTISLDLKERRLPGPIFQHPAATYDTSTNTLYVESTGFTATYNPSTKKITVPWILDAGPAYCIQANLTADDNYSSASEWVDLSMLKADPHLTVTPSATVTVGDDVTATVSYDDMDDATKSGTIDTVTSNNVNVVPTYDSSTKTITVPYVANAGAVEIFVRLSEGSLYTEATYTFSVSMEKKRSPNLVVTPSAYGTKGSQVTATVQYDGGGELHVQSNNSNVQPTVSNNTITLPFYKFSVDTDVTISVSVDAIGMYEDESTTFTVTYSSDSANDSLVAAMPLTSSSPTEDVAGNTWRLNGSARLSNRTLYFDGTAGCTAVTTGFTFGGTFSAISFWFYARGTNSTVLQLTDGKSYIFLNTYSSNDFEVQIDHSNLSSRKQSSSTDKAGISAPRNAWNHFQFETNPNVSGTGRTLSQIFINGNRFMNYSGLLPQGTFTLALGNPLSGKYAFNGMISDLKVYRGAFIYHNGNFTPPARST